MRGRKKKGEPSGTVHLTISLHALFGTNDYHTMRMRGKIKNQSLIMLVDSGSTHNFRDQKAVKRLNCETQTVTSMAVIVANEQILRTTELYKNLK